MKEVAFDPFSWAFGLFLYSVKESNFDFSLGGFFRSVLSTRQFDFFYLIGVEAGLVVGCLFSSSGWIPSLVVIFVLL